MNTINKEVAYYRMWYEVFTKDIQHSDSDSFVPYHRGLLELPVEEIHKEAVEYASTKRNKMPQIKPLIVRTIYGLLYMDQMDIQHFEENVTETFKLIDLVPEQLPKDIDEEELNGIAKVCSIINDYLTEQLGVRWYLGNSDNEGWLGYTEHYYYLESTAEGMRHCLYLNASGIDKEDITDPSKHMYTYEQYVEDTK